ncbi:MAG: DedA family protein [Chlamydiales bacterium]
METILSFIQLHAYHAHWFVFGLLMLAGLNFPISEDLVIIFSAILASTIVPENIFKLFLAVFLGAYLSDWLVYWIGRLWGAHLWRLRWFAYLFKAKRLEQIEQYYQKYGLLTLLVGRFIPFGVRNCLFATAGLGKMRFSKFLIGDGIACLISNGTLFTIAYFFGKNCSYFIRYVNVIFFGIFLIAIISCIWYKKSKAISSTD